MVLSPDCEPPHGNVLPNVAPQALTIITTGAGEFIKVTLTCDSCSMGGWKGYWPVMTRLIRDC